MRMFGGIGFLLRGNMCCGVHGADLIVRVDPKDTAELLKREGVRPFDLSGKPMKGWLLVAPDQLRLDAAFNSWVERSVKFVAGLPPKRK
jgi:TfoX/Sxy family transcriptional regulator of competence genes